MVYTPTRARKMSIWFLVGGVFSVLLLFWIPSLVQTLESFIIEVGKGANASSSQLTQGWRTTQQDFTQLTNTVATLSKRSGGISQQQMEAFANEIQTHTTVNSDDPTSFPVHSDTPISGDRQVQADHSYCTRNNGRYVDRTKNHHDYGVCIFSDGSECESIAFEGGSCRQSQFRHAEDGIKIIPDLVVEVEKAGYCTTRTSPIVWSEDLSVSYICLEGVTIRNIGWGDAKASVIKTAGKYYNVPPLAAGESFTFSDSFPYLKAKVNNKAVIVADAKHIIQEYNEDNNVFTFPK